MLDKADRTTASAHETAGPPRDFQEHLARLEARGLLIRIDRPINKDTELHPLARWQFQGGLPEEERRAAPRLEPWATRVSGAIRPPVRALNDAR